jgi:sulfur-carrier protein
MATIKIPTPLRVYTDGQSQVTVSGATVQEALGDLLVQYPDLEPQIMRDGELRSFVNLFVGADDIRFLAGTATGIDPDAELRIIPSIAGGCAT